MGGRGARQQQAWRRLYGYTLEGPGQAVEAGVRLEGPGAAGVQRPIRGWGRRLAAAWRVLRTGRL
ncbi:MAG: hypothetical protein RMK16_08435 [Acidobacteriota bacterium]|nr:hypothetical protein [Acidobacteriota bacterium]